jgi:hypothetical protein
VKNIGVNPNDNINRTQNLAIDGEIEVRMVAGDVSMAHELIE